MTEYSTSVRSKMLIDKEGTKLETMGVNVDGYADEQKISEAVESYNKPEEIYDGGKNQSLDYKLDEKDWREPLWYAMFNDFRERLKRWRKRHL